MPDLLKPPYPEFNPVGQKRTPYKTIPESGEDIFVLPQNNPYEWGNYNPTLPPNVKNPYDNKESLGYFTDDNKVDGPKLSAYDQFKWDNINTGIGAGLFAANAYLSKRNQQRNERDYNQRLQNIFTQKPLDGSYEMYGHNNRGGSEYQPIIMAEEGAKIRGGSSPSLPIELEGGELVQLPDLTLEKVEGPSHAEGGVHTILPDGSQVFSNKLKPLKSKKTFSQLATPISKKINMHIDALKNPFSPKIDKRTSELMLPRLQSELNSLFQQQQQMNNNSSGRTFKDGGEVLKYPNGGKKKPEKSKNELNQEVPLESPIVNPAEMINKILYPEDNISIPAPPTPKFVEPVATPQGVDPNKIGYSPWLGDNQTPPGKENKSRYTAQQIDELATKLGYTGPKTNLGLQQYILANPEMRKVVDELHKKYGIPKAGKPDDGKWGYRWDAILDELTNKSNPATTKNPGLPVSNPSNITQSNTAQGNYNFQEVGGAKSTLSNMGRFPAYQAIPELTGYVSGLKTYPYFTPDFNHAEINPTTLNIQPQLESIDSSFQSAIRQNTGNPSVNNSRNNASYIAALQSKQQAFGNKQNFDANSRFQADQYNAEARTKENYNDLSTAANIHNELRAGAYDAAAGERQSAISHLTNKTANYYQDEFKKMMYFDTMFQNYYYDGQDRSHPIKQDMQNQEDFTSTGLSYFKQNRKK